MLLPLAKGDFHREVEDIHNRWFHVLCQERVLYYDNCGKEGINALQVVEIDLQTLL